MKGRGFSSIKWQDAMVWLEVHQGGEANTLFYPKRVM